MKLLAPAKLNLYLHVTGRRADGYHLLDSLVIFTEWGDELTLSPCETLSLNIVGPFAAGLPVEGNLVLRAAQRLQRHASIQSGVAIELHKQIPIGAGLGGGSSDAAALMRGLNDFWQLGLSLETLAEIAAPLGADMTACLWQTPLHMAGIGEEITPMDGVALDQAILLVNPGFELLTAEVYRAFANTSAFSAEVPAEARQLYAHHRNDLEPAAIALRGEIAEVLSWLNQQAGCQLARLCGSGATCFGLFDDESAAQQAVEAIRRYHPAWWHRITHQRAAPSLSSRAH